MKTFHYILLLPLLIFYSIGSIANEGEAVIGQWFTSDKTGKIELYPCGGKLCGKIVWLENPPPVYGNPPKDVNNPNASLRGRELIGMNLLEGFVKKGDNYWEGGTIYDPENGKTYKCNMKLEGDVLNVRGYIGFSLLGRTEKWTKVK